MGGRKTAVLTHFESFLVRVKPKNLLYFSLPKLFVPGFPKNCVGIKMFLKHSMKGSGGRFCKSVGDEITRLARTCFAY